MSQVNQPEADSSLIGQRQLRLNKVAQMREMGIDPYPANAHRTHFAQAIHDNFSELENTDVFVAGRLMKTRSHGKLMFMDLADETGQIQLYIKEDTLKPFNSEKQTLGWAELNLIDEADHIEAHGQVTKTTRGEISVLVDEIRIVSKSIRPLPTELEDKEDRYRRRYLDMTLHPEIRERFRRRSLFWQAVREFMNSKGFVEINIPVLEHTTGGADAKPFVTHYDALDQDFFLRISHELPLKRLLGGGFDKVYDIGVRFRNEGFSDEHLPEHIAMEWYWAYANASQGMELTTEMFRYVIQKVYGKQKFNMKGFEVDLSKEWERIDYVGVIKERFNVDPLIEDVNKMNQILKQNGVDLGEDVNRNRVVDNLWKLIRKTIAGPAFLINEPKVFSPLAKSKPENPEITDRFHAVIAGSELANAYSELNDPVDQLDRFMEQEELRESGDDEAQMLDIDFVEMLEYGMPPACGFGLAERVFWFFEDATAKEAIPFPQLKFEVDDLTRKIYPHINFDKEKGLVETEEFKALTTVNINSAPTVDLCTLSPEVAEKFPGIKFGYIVMDGVNVDKASSELQQEKKHIESRVRKFYLDTQEVERSESIKGFRELYKQFGTDPDSHMNSAEALMKRIVSGKGIYDINNVVDTYNLTSIENELPMAAYDLDKVSGNIELRFAQQGDSIIRIGETESIPMISGELVYADEAGVICMDFNYRDADRTKITDSTNKIIVFVDGHSGVSEQDIKETLSKAATRLTKYTGGKLIAKGFSWNNSVITNTNMTTTREQAHEFLNKYVSDEYLLHHSEMVATAMKAAGNKLGENADKFYITGLIHDWDFDQWPDEHPGRYDQLQSELGVDEEVIGAIKGHGDKEYDRSTNLMRALLALDELSGLYYAYMKMVGSYGAMKISSIQKKLHKELNFAAKIDRSYVLKGIEELGIPEEELLTLVRDTFAAKYDQA